MTERPSARPQSQSKSAQKGGQPARLRAGLEQQPDAGLDQRASLHGQPNRPTLSGGAPPPGAPLGWQQLRQLQRSVGNRAVARLLAGHSQAEPLQRTVLLPGHGKKKTQKVAATPQDVIDWIFTHIGRGEHAKYSADDNKLIVFCKEGPDITLNPAAAKQSYNDFKDLFGPFDPNNPKASVQQAKTGGNKLPSQTTKGGTSASKTNRGGKLEEKEQQPMRNAKLKSPSNQNDEQELELEKKPTRSKRALKQEQLISDKSEILDVKQTKQPSRQKFEKQEMSDSSDEELETVDVKSSSSLLSDEGEKELKQGPKKSEVLNSEMGLLAQELGLLDDPEFRNLMTKKVFPSSNVKGLVGEYLIKGPLKQEVVPDRVFRSLKICTVNTSNKGGQWTSKREIDLLPAKQESKGYVPLSLIEVKTGRYDEKLLKRDLQQKHAKLLDIATQRTSKGRKLEKTQELFLVENDQDVSDLFDFATILKGVTQLSAGPEEYHDVRLDTDKLKGLIAFARLLHSAQD